MITPVIVSLFGEVKVSYLQMYLKRDFGMSVFLWILQSF